MTTLEKFKQSQAKQQQYYEDSIKQLKEKLDNQQKYLGRFTLYDIC